MKRLAIAFLILLAAGDATAQWYPLIGIYGSEAGVTCELDMDPYVQATAYLLAVLPDDMPGITACEFRIDNLPTPEMALIFYDWNTPLVIGSAGYGIALAFSPPLIGRAVPLGSISLYPLLNIPDDWRLTIEPSYSSGQLLVVDLSYEEIPANGDFLTLNCTGAIFWGCNCLFPWWTTAVQENSWGQIKALY